MPRKGKQVARPITDNGMIEELAMEITARMLDLESGPLHPVMVHGHFEAIKTASKTICSITSGIRTSKSKVNARLAEVLG